MKHMLHLFTALLLTAALCIGCGYETESQHQDDPAASVGQEISATETVVPMEQLTEAPSRENAAEGPRDFDSYTDEEVLNRLNSPLPNYEFVPGYHTPGAPFNYIILPETGDSAQALQKDSPNDQPMQLLKEDDLYAVYAYPQQEDQPTLLLKQFREAGNGYAYYDGGMDEESVLANFDIIAHDQKLLCRWYRDDPEIKCISYEFYAVKDKGDGTAEFGWYCYLIDRFDHMVSLTPEWNRMRTISLTGEPLTEAETVPEPEREAASETSAAPGQEQNVLTDEDIENMEIVDNAISELIDSPAWADASQDLRRNLASECLKELASQKLVIEDSILASEDMVSFQYACHVGGGIKLTPFDPLMN